MKRIAFVLVLALAALGLVTPWLSSAHMSGPSASGTYRFVMEDGASKSVEFSVTSDERSTIVGATGGNRGGNNGVTYANLMTSDDGNGANRSYLANEENFTVVKDLEARNLIVPVVGDFGGDKAIRAVATYLKSVNAMVSAFYLSNVEQFLVQDGKWNTFCSSATTLPLDETSFFIRSGRGRNGFGGGVQNSSAANMLLDLVPCRASRN